MKVSLGVILALCLAGLQFIAVSALVFSSYLTSERALLEHARGLLSDVGTNTIEHSKGFLKPASEAAELATRLAESQVVASDDLEQLERLLFQQLQIAPQFSGVFFGGEDGSFVFVNRNDGPAPFRSKIITWDDGVRTTELIWRRDDYSVINRELDPGDTYNPRTRPWYLQAKGEMGSIWTDPYIFFTSQKPGITVASPVFSGTATIHGVIGVDIEIDAISSFLSHLQIGDNGTALIINRNGDVIAHPNPSLIMNRNADGTSRFLSINEIGDPIARAAFGSITQNGEVSIEQEISSRFDFDGASYVSTVKPSISDTIPWTIAVYAPEADFTTGIRANRTQNMWIAAAIALITGITGLIMARIIHRPVRAFAVRSALISQGELPASAPLPKTYKELERVNETLVHEIAERKKSQREYGKTFDLATRGMAQIESETGRILRANARFAEILGYRVDELEHLTVHHLSPPDNSNDLLFFGDSVGDDTEYLHETRCVRKDGEIIWASVHAIMIHDDHGEPLHAVVTIEDLTEIKRKEIKIQQLNRDMAHTARVNMMGHMATSLAHELNQPLTAITQNMDAALFSVKSDTNKSDLSEILRETEQQAHRAGDIIRSLRELLRKDEVEKGQVDLGELIEETLHLIRPEAKNHGVVIKTRLDALSMIEGSRVQIAQVIMNLVRNSVESIAGSPANGGEVIVSARGYDRGIEISVEDTGPGFSADFDPFAKFETTKKDGMGLGLSICQTIVEAHGGKLWFERKGKLPKFSFSIPVKVLEVQQA